MCEVSVMSIALMHDSQESHARLLHNACMMKCSVVTCYLSLDL